MNWKMYRNEEVEFVDEITKYCVFRDCDIRLEDGAEIKHCILMGKTKVWAGSVNATMRACVIIGDKTKLGGDEDGVLTLQGNTCLIDIGIGSKAMLGWEKHMDPEVYKKLQTV